jgi:chromate transporter
VRPSRQTLFEIARIFLTLGTVSFGGPAAHIALMEDEFVVRRRWLRREDFLDLLGATNLIPGPNSTEMAISLGYLRGGWRGWLVAGAAFILPAVSITVACAWLYVRAGTLPQTARWWFGIPPAALAVIALAAWRLGRPAVKTHRHAILGLGVIVAALLGTSEIAALFLAGLVGMLWLRGAPAPAGTARIVTVAAVLMGTMAVCAAPGVAVVPAPLTTWNLGTVFLRIGSVLYGSGYVLIAFLDKALVRDRGWLTERQLLDAIAVGQFTPGPVLSTAAFIGYVLAGVPGALIATAGIFLPSFAFVAALHAVLPRVRRNERTAAFLDAVNVAAMGLIVAVTVGLSSTLTDWRQWAIAAGTLLAGAIFRPHTGWLIVAGAVVGALLF